MDTMTSSKVQQLLEEAKQLPTEARAILVDELMINLYPADPDIQASWVKEAQRRLAAFDAGEVAELTEEEFFAEFDEP